MIDGLSGMCVGGCWAGPGATRTQHELAAQAQELAQTCAKMAALSVNFSAQALALQDVHQQTRSILVDLSQVCCATALHSTCSSGQNKDSRSHNRTQASFLLLL